MSLLNLIISCLLIGLCTASFQIGVKTEEHPFPTARNILQWPFANWSIWNLPIGKEARYVFAGLHKATSWGMTIDSDIIILKPNAPQTNVYFNSDGWSHRSRCDIQGGVIYGGPIPTDFVVPGANGGSTPNNAAALLQADGHTIEQGQPFTRCTAGGPATSLVRYPNSDIYTDGIVGAHGGSGMSSLGGTLRIGELMKGSGPVRHALKINLDSVNYYSGGTPASYRWPAQKADGCAPGCYTGNNPALKMGSLLALNTSVDLDKLGFETEPGKSLAWTFQNYGAYIVDTTGWSVYAIETEQSPDGVYQNQFSQSWGFSLTPQSKDTPWSRDMDRIFLSLSVVDSWNEDIWKRVVASNGNEGAGGGQPLQPWAPPY